MANKIILKKTSTASKVPLPADLEVGEIAVNLADQKLYSKNAGGTVVLVGTGTVGTVTSVGITPSIGVTVSNSPITTSGNITVGLSTKLTAIENLSGAGFITQNGTGVIAGRTIQAGTGISVAHGNGSSQDPVITNAGVTSIIAGTGIAVSSSTGAVTVSIANVSTGFSYDTFTATASQTTFTTFVAYTSGKIAVYRNGVKQRNGGDVTVTSGNTVVFTTPCVLGDVIDANYPIVAQSGSIIYENLTATASQTTFTTSNSYTSGKIEVFKNGSKQRNGSDVTVTSGNTVVFAVACTVGDLVDLVYPS